MNPNSIYIYLNNYVKRDLINKYNYKNTCNIPSIKKVLINLGGKTSDLNSISKYCICLEFLTGLECYITTSKKNNLSKKIRLGSPVGAVAYLKKKRIYEILSYLLTELKPKVSNSNGRNFDVLNNQNSFSFSFSKQEFNSLELFEFNRHIFKDIPEIKVTFVFNRNLSKLEQKAIRLLQL